MDRFFMWSILHKPSGNLLNHNDQHIYNDNSQVQLFYNRKLARLIKKNGINEKYPYRSTKVVKVKVSVELED
jgi:hypothetical protein